MSRVANRRWFAWLALVGLIAQAALPSLRVTTANAGELRAEAILATSLCSKPTLSVADRIAALLNPWNQHSSKAKHQHCDSCPQSIDVPAAITGGAGQSTDFPNTDLTVAKAFGVWFASALALVPPSRAPPAIS
jgi:hypothetical protein